LFESSILSYFLFICIVVSIVIAISFITYKYIEQPFIVLGKNYIRRGEK